MRTAAVLAPALPVSRRRLSPGLVRAAAALIAFLWPVAVRLHTALPFDRDVSTYAVMAREMLAGRNLYTDIFDQKPPAVYVTYAVAERAAGNGDAAVVGLYVAAVALILAGIGSATAGLGAVAGSMALLFAGAALSSLDLESIQPNSEIFINASLVWAFALAVRPRGTVGRGRFLSACGLVALASLYKHVAAIPGGFFLAARALHDARTLDRGPALRFIAGRAAMLAAVGAAAWTATWAYFAAHGRGGDFIDTMIRYNMGYSGMSGGWVTKSIANLKVTLGEVPGVAVPIIAAAAVAALLAAGSSLRAPARAMAFAYLAGAAAAVAAPAQFFPHYFQLLLPPLALGGAVALNNVNTRRAATALSAALIAAFVADGLAAYRLDAAAMRGLYGRRFTPARQIAADVNGLLRPSETFFDWGNEAWLYYYTGRIPPAGVLFADHARTSALAPRIAARTVAQLSAARPELVVVSRWRSDDKVFGNPVGRWLKENYRPLPGGDRGFLYFMARKGGRLLSASGGGTPEGPGRS